MKIEVLIGMIGSGKTTYARRRADEGAIVVSHDSLTEMLHASYRYEASLRELYMNAMKGLAALAILEGRDVIIDRTHLTAESRVNWVKFSRELSDPMAVAFLGVPSKVEIIAVTFTIEHPVVHASRRFASDARGRSLSDWEAVARHHHHQALCEPLDWIAEGFDARKSILVREAAGGLAVPSIEITFDGGV